jgi:nucleoside-diphosphate-sugar epimerase
MPPRTILVTGATGFVGRTLCRMLSERGERVRAAIRAELADRSSVSAEELAVVGNVGTTTDWSEALQGVDAVIHLVSRVHVMRDRASDPLTAFRRVNAEGTAALARACVAAGIRRLVFVSTIKVNGESTDHAYTERDAPDPRDPYGVSKLEAEQRLAEIASGTALETVVVRPPVVYGPGVKGNIGRLLDLVYYGVPLPLGNVDNRRSMVGVRNLSSLLIECTKARSAAGELFLASDAEDLSTPELMRRLAVFMHRPSRLFPFPVCGLRAAGRATRTTAIVERLVGSLRVDASKARSVLSWTAPFSVDDELAETARWYLATRRSRP